MDSMRVLFCNYEYPPLGGGGGVLTRALAAELAQRHTVTVLTSGAFGLPRETIDIGGVRVLRVPVPFRRHTAVATLPSMLAFLVGGLTVGYRLLGRDDCDILNTHFVLPTGPVGDRLARAARIPHVLSVLGGDLYDPSKRISPHRHLVLRVWIRRLLRRAAVVVGGSRNTVENVHRFYAADVPVTLIPLGIARPAIHKATRAQFGCRDDEVVLVTVGRLVSRKAVHQLVEMMGRLRERPVRLLIVGSGPQENALRADIARRGLASRVRLLGQLTDVEKFRALSVADVYVSASQHEGFGLVFLEAMACGLPVVAYDHGGQADFLRDAETGFLVALNDLDALTDRCLRLVDDGELRRAFGTATRAVAEAGYIDRCAAMYEALFHNTIANRAAIAPPAARRAVA
jgi:glycosyltransferase involved in cell wall biosynthesis